MNKNYGSHIPRPSQSHDSSMMRASSLRSIVGHDSGAARQQSLFLGSMHDVSGRNAFARDSVSTLARGTPLAQRFADSNSTLLARGDYPRESGIPRLNPNQDVRSATISSSIGGSCRSSSAFPPNAPLTGDPRPLADQKYRRVIMTKLHEFLVAHEFNWKQRIQFDVNALLTPADSTVKNVFEFLMRKLLGDYVVNPDSKVFHDDMKNYATLLGYPYANTLKKNVLEAPSGNSSRPIVIGFLDWLREEVEAWMAMTAVGENGESGLDTLFFRPESDDGTEWNIDSVFNNARMDFMRNATRIPKQFPDPIADKAERANAEHELFQAFDARMTNYVGDVTERAEQLQAELIERIRVVRERAVTYESLDMINAKIHEKDISIQNKKREIEDIKIRGNKAEEDIVNFQKEDRLAGAEIKTIRENIVKLEAKIKKQHLTKQAYIDGIKEEEAMQRSVAQINGEMTGIRKRIEILLSDKAKHIQKLHEMVRDLRDGLVEMDATVGVDDLPYYDDNESVEDYIATMKNRVDHIILNIRTRAEKARLDFGSSEAEQHRLSKLLEELKTNEGKLVDQERDVRVKLTELEKQKTVGRILELETKKSDLAAQLDAGESRLLELQNINSKLDKKVARQKKIHAQVLKDIGVAKAADMAYRDGFCNKQRERSGKVDAIAAEVETHIEKASEVKATLISGMLKALSGRD